MIDAETREVHQGADDCEAGYCDPLAPCRLQIVSALEIAAPLRSTDRTVGNSPADPRDEHRQPVVGGTENSLRASEARHRHRPDQRRQVRGAEEGPSPAGMEDVSSQPCGGIAAMDLFVVPTISFRPL
jgi:hypothetical protein